MSNLHAHISDFYTNCPHGGWIEMATQELTSILTITTKSQFLPLHAMHAIADAGVTEASP